VCCAEDATIEVSLGSGYQLSFAVQLPPELKNNMRGLMGNYNGNPSDDLTSSDGRTIPSDSNEETIYNDFCVTCELISPFRPSCFAPRKIFLILVRLTVNVTFLRRK